MIFHIPHSSKIIPQEQRSILDLDDQKLNRELIAVTDAYSDELFGAHATATDKKIIFPISRLIVDPERFLDDADEVMTKFGMGVIYTNTSNGKILRKKPSGAERKSLIREYYLPHHDLVANAVRKELEKNGRALIIDCHSFPSSPLPYELDKNPNRPDICIGTDVFHTPLPLCQAAAEESLKQGFKYSVNQPFSGALVPSEFYRNNKNVYSIMIELNRKLYMNEETGEKSLNFKTCQIKLGYIIDMLRSLNV
jgi:N-formylglutamate deformylase